MSKPYGYQQSVSHGQILSYAQHIRRSMGTCTAINALCRRGSGHALGRQLTLLTDHYFVAVTKNSPYFNYWFIY